MIEREPRNAIARYNLACTLTQQGRLDDASKHLLDAVAIGFTHFQEMKRDPSLDPLRSHPVYVELAEHIPEILDARGDAQYRLLNENTSQDYATSRDHTLRLNFACASDDESFAHARREVQRVASWVDATLFETGASRPDDAWVAVILPTPEDFFRLVRGSSTVGGYYDLDARRLVTQDAGPTLRHEFFHVLHHRHQAHLGQRHALWIQEGLAALLEDADVSEDGTFRVMPSWRTNSAKRLARTTRFPTLEYIARLSPERYTRQRPKANYAISRAFFMYLIEQDRLRDFYTRYCADFDSDPTGVSTIEHTLEKPMRSVNREFRAWLRELPEVGERLRPGDASLGVDLRAGSGSGPVVSVRFQDWNRAHATPFRSGDVIKSINGRDVRSIDDLHRILGSYAPGQVASVRVARWSKPLDLDVKLIGHNP